MTLFRNSSILHLGLACVLIAGVSMGHAQSTASLTKHAHKIQHKLAKYSDGRYLHLVLRNDTNSYGTLGTLSEDSFTFTRADNNSIATYSYNDIDKVKLDKQPIGQGTEPRYHIRHLAPILVTAAAVGAAGAVYAVER